MTRAPWLALAFVLFLPVAETQARDWLGRGRRELESINARLQGHIVDYTHNHGSDNRIWSEALGQKRDLYVYLPPGFDPAKRYALIFLLHGYAQDERAFLHFAVEDIDSAIANGSLPPAIIAVPDGSIEGDGCATQAGSFFINSKAGRFEDFVMQDVWNFVLTNYPIRPEREAHAFLGVSMGGGASFRLAMRYRDRIGIAAGIMPPLNTRYADCHGRYMRPFDPCCQGLRTDLSHGHETIAVFYHVIHIHLKRLLDPIYDRSQPDAALAQISRENPYEMLDATDLHNGELALFVGYGGRDEFNLAAQVESFLYKAKQRGIEIQVAYVPKGHHSYATYAKVLPCLFDWIKPLVEPYRP